MVKLWVGLTSVSIRADVEVVIVVVNDVVIENEYLGSLDLVVKVDSMDVVV